MQQLPQLLCVLVRHRRIEPLRVYRATIEIQVTSERNEGDVCVFFLFLFDPYVSWSPFIEWGAKRSGSGLNELEG